VNEAFRQLRYLTPPEHVHRTHVEDAWIAGQHRAAGKLNGLLT
jgi:hypothetical protein